MLFHFRGRGRSSENVLSPVYEVSSLEMAELTKNWENKPEYAVETASQENITEHFNFCILTKLSYREGTLCLHV